MRTLSSRSCDAAVHPVCHAVFRDGNTHSLGLEPVRHGTLMRSATSQECLSKPTNDNCGESNERLTAVGGATLASRPVPVQGREGKLLKNFQIAFLYSVVPSLSHW